MFSGLIRKYNGLISYAFFGICTTAINILTYRICYYGAGVSNVISNIAAWVLAVAFAFVTNKQWVFSSKSWDKSTVLTELIRFTTCRLSTGLMDLAIMYSAVDLLGMNGMVWKVISNILVIIVNYVAGKTVVFVKKGNS